MVIKIKNPKNRTLEEFLERSIYRSREDMEETEAFQLEQCKKFPTTKHAHLREYERIRASGNPHWYVCDDGIVYALMSRYHPRMIEWWYQPVGFYAPVRGHAKTRYSHLTLIEGAA